MASAWSCQYLTSSFSCLLCISVPWPVYLCNYWLSQTSCVTLWGICWFSSLKSLLHCCHTPLLLHASSPVFLLCPVLPWLPFPNPTFLTWLVLVFPSCDFHSHIPVTNSPSLSHPFSSLSLAKHAPPIPLVSSILKCDRTGHSEHRTEFLVTVFLYQKGMEEISSEEN